MNPAQLNSYENTEQMKNNPHTRLDEQNVIIERSYRLTSHLRQALHIYNTRESFANVNEMEKRLKYEKRLREAARTKKKGIISAIHELITTSENPMAMMEKLGYKNNGWSNGWSLKKRQLLRVGCGHVTKYKCYAKSPNTEWTFCHECKYFYRSDMS